MPTLTYNEGAVIDAVRHLEKRFPEGVPAIAVRARVLDIMAYDAAQRALRGLVSLGLVERPKRGHYLPATASSTFRRPAPEDGDGA